VKILVTAGNTQTDIDRVRCITNVFSGRTGAQIAAEAFERGHAVSLLTSHPEEKSVKNRKNRRQFFFMLLPQAGAWADAPVASARTTIPVVHSCHAPRARCQTADRLSPTAVVRSVPSRSVAYGPSRANTFDAPPPSPPAWTTPAFHWSGRRAGPDRGRRNWSTATRPDFPLNVPNPRIPNPRMPLDRGVDCAAATEHRQAEVICCRPSPAPPRPRARAAGV
jgi:hypothetical protein